MECLTLIGTVAYGDGFYYGIIVDGDGFVNTVVVGDFLGKLHGKVVQIMDKGLYLTEILFLEGEWTEQNKYISVVREYDRKRCKGSKSKFHR